MKGQLEIPIIIVIFGLVFVIGVISSVRVLVGPLVRVVEYVILYDNSQMALIALLH